MIKKKSKKVYANIYIYFLIVYININFSVKKIDLKIFFKYISKTGLFDRLK